MFIFDALLEEFTSGDTSIKSTDFGSEFTKLTKQGSKSGLTKQFKVRLTNFNLRASSVVATLGALPFVAR